MGTLNDVLHNPRALLPKRHIFLLSHMRAYSSLLGHIMGSNPAICGYYEMHIGYHSWKSLMRQKLLYFREEEAKPGATSMFDKVLHNDHAMADDVLNHPRSKHLFALRPPQETVPSIVKLYRQTEPGHEFAQADFSAAYYINRVMELQRLAERCRNPFFYLDAQCLKTQPEAALAALTSWLALDPPLSKEYDLQKKTSAQRYGDTSPALRAGRIDHTPRSYDTQDINPDLLQKATDAYLSTRKRLIALSGCAHTVTE